MANVLVEKQSLIDTADAIRAKLGTQALIAPEDFDDRIREISGGGGDYGTVTVCAMSYTSSVEDYTGCTVTIDDADAFYEAALTNGWINIGTDVGDIVGDVYLQDSGQGWASQNDYNDTITTAELNQCGVTVNQTASWASFNVRFVFTFNTSSTTQLSITEKVDFLSLGYLSTKYERYGGMGNDSAPGTFVINGTMYIRPQIISYTIGEDVDKIPDCFLSTSYNLNSVSITGATEIGGYFLYGCYNFNGTVTIPSTVTKIGQQFMSGCEAFDHAITVPSSVLSIGSGFLYGCTGFNSAVTISAPVTRLSSFMTNCTSFNQPFTIPSTVTELHEFMTDCSAFNQPLVLPNGLKTLTAFLSRCTVYNQPITIPSSVTKVSNCMYQMPAFNSTVTFSEGLEELGGYMFYQSTAFNKAITLPSTLKTIGWGFLYGATAFNSTLTLGGVESINNGFMNNCTSFNKDITVPSTATSIGSDFMYNCNAMVSTVFVETSYTPAAGNSLLATTSSSAPCYTTGIKVGGTYGASWRSRFTNRTSSPYRKLIAA